MLGSIMGDICGSTYEFKKKLPEVIDLFAEGSNFTDDTILTVAVADVLMNGGSYTQTFRYYHDMYPAGQYGYGGMFKKWVISTSQEGYGSYGNGSAMRVSPVIWVSRDEQDVLDLAEETAIATHNHPEGVKGAQAIALAGFMALDGASKEEIEDYIEGKFGYDIASQVPNRKVFEVTCQDTVPKAIKVFMECDNFEQTMRRSMVMGRDTDTMACMAGAIMEPFLYGKKGLPSDLKKYVFSVLDKTLGEKVVEFMRDFVDPEYDPECEIQDGPIKL